MTDERSKPSEKRDDQVRDLPEKKVSAPDEEQVKGGAIKRQVLDSDSHEPTNG